MAGGDDLDQEQNGQKRGGSDRPFLPLGGESGPDVDGHQDEDEKDHDGPGVDQDLDDRGEGRAEQAEEAAQRGEGQDQEKRAVGLVAGQNHAYDGPDADRGQQVKKNFCHSPAPNYIGNSARVNPFFRALSSLHGCGIVYNTGVTAG